MRRRSVLGGAAAGVAGALLGPGTAWAGGGSPDRAVDVEASRLDRRLIALRRDLHRHPEVAGQEHYAAAVVARELRRAGLHVITGVGGTGVVGVLDGSRPGRTVAYRADMDAVPPESQNGGSGVTAHLCGHDLHTTIGIGAALVLARLRRQLAGRVVFVFQPGEESLSGAAAMLADGVFDRVRPAEIHALHCGPFAVGEFAVTPGSGMCGQDTARVAFTGPDAATRAQRFADDVDALSTVALTPTSEGLQQLVDDILTPHGPLESFVLTRSDVRDAQVQLALRCWPATRQEELRATVRGLAGAAGATSVQFTDTPWPAMVTPEREGRALQRYLERTLGRSRVLVQQAPIPFVTEDFTLFLRELPGTYTWLGVRKPGADILTCSPHFGPFDPDERAIGHGVRAMAGWLAVRTAA